jgi:hypothetical protein
MGVTVEGITFDGDDAYERVGWRTVILNKRTVAGMLAVEKQLGRQVDSVPQGSYNESNDPSAGTHDGGGAIDIYDDALDKIEQAMRAVGFAAWHRPSQPPPPDGWGKAHCHGIMLADKEMSSEARQQVHDYRNYIDGLAGHDTPDNTSHPFPKGDEPRPIFDYREWVRKQDDMDFDDKIPSTNNKTVGDALRSSLQTEAGLAEFRANVAEFRANEAAFRADTGKRFDDLDKAIAEIARKL